MLLRQVKHSHEEDSHLGACDRAIGTVLSNSAATGDAFICKLFDPRSRPVIRGYIRKLRARGRRRHVARTVFRFQQEDCHPGAGHINIGTIISAATAAGDAFCGKLLDPVKGPMRGRHVRKALGAGGRVVPRAVLGAQEEDRHLGARHVVDHLRYTLTVTEYIYLM